MTNNSFMNVAEYHSNSDIRIKKIVKPKINDKEILVQMRACGICGTDVMEWYRKKKGPRVLGHEMSGEVVEVGDGVETIKKKDRVFVSHHVPCFDCFYCNSKKFSACSSLHEGNFYPGGFSEYIKVPEENVKFGTFILPKGMTYDEASMIEPMACAVAGQKILNTEKNQTVIIIGAGISGLTHIQIAKTLGAKIISTDLSEYRLKQAKKFGADHTFKATEISVSKIKKINEGRLADNVILCTGNPPAVEDTFRYVDKKGKILFFAVPSSPIKLPSTELWRNEISVFFSYGASPDDIKHTLKLYEKGEINFRDMITHRFPLSRIIEGFHLVKQAKESIKIVVNPD